MVYRLVYAGGILDRSDNFRGDEDWIARRLADDSTRIVPVRRSRNLIRRGSAPRAHTIPVAEGAEILKRADHVAFLGVEDGVAYVAAEMSGADEPLHPSLTDGAEFVDLRHLGSAMEGHEAALLAYARGIMHWHARHGFCGVCGAPTEPRRAGHMRVCTETACGAEHFPRTDPAVIMLVTGAEPDGSCLLARQAVWPPGMYSSLAGFVEPGESLEEAVAREVKEEVGLEVADVRYRASQPWPFPQSLMVGFRARAVGVDIRRNADELEDARWFTRAELRDPVTTPLRFSRGDSIARWLLQEWLDEYPPS